MNKIVIKTSVSVRTALLKNGVVYRYFIFFKLNQWLVILALKVVVKYEKASGSKINY